jgi:hypothetical protein
MCVASYQGNSCSCLSGFGGSNKCDARPTGTCTYNTVSPTELHFAPTVAASVSNDALTLSIASNLEQSIFANPNSDNSQTGDSSYALDTRVLFGSTSTPCDYPPTLLSQAGWSHSSSDASCTDNWALTLPWASARSACGFTDNGDHTFSQTVTVIRRYQLPTIGGVTTYRNESISKVVTIAYVSQKILILIFFLVSLNL